MLMNYYLYCLKKYFMTITQIEYIVAVEKNGSFVLAAEKAPIVLAAPEY